VNRVVHLVIVHPYKTTWTYRWYTSHVHFRRRFAFTHEGLSIIQKTNVYA